MGHGKSIRTDWGHEASLECTHTPCKPHHRGITNMSAMTSFYLESLPSQDDKLPQKICIPKTCHQLKLENEDMYDAMT